LLLILPTGALCGEVSDSVKSVGQGLVIGGSAGNNPVSAAISVLGGILSVGADLFSGGTLNQDELLKNAASKWNKPKTVSETQTLLQLRQASASDGELTSKIEATIGRAKAEAESGHFATKHRLEYISLMFRFDKGEWVVIAYPVNNALILNLWCNKESSNCMLGTFSEHINLPTFRDTSANLKKI
jgi:hypothetical protein